jgi:hypothetical protein
VLDAEGALVRHFGPATFSSLGGNRFAAGVADETIAVFAVASGTKLFTIKNASAPVVLPGGSRSCPTVSGSAIPR